VFRESHVSGLFVNRPGGVVIAHSGHPKGSDIYPLLVKEFLASLDLLTLPSLSFRHGVNY